MILSKLNNESYCLPSIGKWHLLSPLTPTSNEERKT